MNTRQGFGEFLGLPVRQPAHDGPTPVLSSRGLLFLDFSITNIHDRIPRRHAFGPHHLRARLTPPSYRRFGRICSGSRAWTLTLGHLERTAAPRQRGKIASSLARNEPIWLCAARRLIPHIASHRGRKFGGFSVIRSLCAPSAHTNRS